MSTLTISSETGSIWNLAEGFPVTTVEGPPSFYGTYDDGDGAGSDWTVGEALTDNTIATANFTVAGYITLNGTNYPVLDSNQGDSPDLYLFAYDLPDAAAVRDAFVSNYDTADYSPELQLRTDDSPPCFYAGSMIATPNGATAVEALQIGDMVRTASGRSAPVLWVGEAKLSPFFNRANSAPVRIKAGALGGGLPEQDLLVTADHGMLIEGLVINASALVNHDTILFEPLDALPDRFSYYHVELENHDVILANGAETESYLDVPTRSKFSNFRDYLDLYGAERLMREMKAPRISARRLLPDTVSRRLGVRSAVVEDRAFVA